MLVLFIIYMPKGDPGRGERGVREEEPEGCRHEPARRTHRARLHARAGGALLHAPAGRPRRARDQGRAAGRRRRHARLLPPARGGTQGPEQLLRALQRGQGKHRDRPCPSGGALRGARPRARGGRADREFRARDHGAPRDRLRGGLGRESRNRLLLHLGLRPDRPAARPPGLRPPDQRRLGRDGPRPPGRAGTARRLPAIGGRACGRARVRARAGGDPPARAHRAGRVPGRLDAAVALGRGRHRHRGRAEWRRDHQRAAPRHDHPRREGPAACGAVHRRRADVGPPARGHGDGQSGRSGDFFHAAGQARPLAGAAQADLRLARWLRVGGGRDGGAVRCARALLAREFDGGGHGPSAHGRAPGVHHDPPSRARRGARDVGTFPRRRRAGAGARRGAVSRRGAHA